MYNSVMSVVCKPYHVGYKMMWIREGEYRELGLLSCSSRLQHEKKDILYMEGLSIETYKSMYNVIDICCL